MERLKEDKARIFDNFYSNDNLNMLKIISFFMDEGQRPMIAMLIKYMELNICMQKSRQRNNTPAYHYCNNSKIDFEEILCEIEDYLPQAGREMMEQMKNMKENMEMYSQMMEMMNMMNENTPQEDCPNASNPAESL